MTIPDVFGRLRVFAPTRAATDAGKPSWPAGRRTTRTDSLLRLWAWLKLSWEQIQVEYERHRHVMFPDWNGAYVSRSRYYGWLVQFDGKGFAITPDSEEWTWGLELERWGRLGHEMAAGGPARMEKDLNRLAYQREGITEWFVNGKGGLQHGFTIHERPPGEDGEVSLQLRVRGDWAADADASAAAVSFQTGPGGAVLHYPKLAVTDANGRRLAARMVATEQALRMLVDDRQAAYPIAVDPIAQLGCSPGGG